MDYEIRQEQKRKIAGFHMVGPWEHTVKQGFEQLMTSVIDSGSCQLNGLPSITTIQMSYLQKNSAAIPWCPWQRISSCRTIVKA